MEVINTWNMLSPCQYDVHLALSIPTTIIPLPNFTISSIYRVFQLFSAIWSLLHPLTHSKIMNRLIFLVYTGV